MVQVMKYKLATPMTGLDIGLKREWLIGQQLNTITGEDGELHGMCSRHLPFLHLLLPARRGFLLPPLLQCHQFVCDALNVTHRLPCGLTISRAQF